MSTVPNLCLPKSSFHSSWDSRWLSDWTSSFNWLMELSALTTSRTLLISLHRRQTVFLHVFSVLMCPLVIRWRVKGFKGKENLWLRVITKKQRKWVLYLSSGHKLHAFSSGNSASIRFTKLVATLLSIAVVGVFGLYESSCPTVVSGGRWRCCRQPDARWSARLFSCTYCWQAGPSHLMYIPQLGHWKSTREMLDAAMWNRDGYSGCTAWKLAGIEMFPDCVCAVVPWVTTVFPLLSGPSTHWLLTEHFTHVTAVSRMACPTKGVTELSYMAPLDFVSLMRPALWSMVDKTEPDVPQDHLRNQYCMPP